MSNSCDDAGFGPALTKAGWVVRPATAEDMSAVLRLRANSFRGSPMANDQDDFDARFHHLWVGQAGREPSATVRWAVHRRPADLLQGYAAQSYDLSGMAQISGPILELGRLCRAPSSRHDDGDLMRLIWAGVARMVLASGAKRLIGCPSFPTTDPEALAPGLAFLAQASVGPAPRRPGIKAARTYALSSVSPGATASIADLPPLLRLYLMLGGWVSDHLVVDEDLGTCHIFTCVEIETMPEARRRVLTRMARP